MEKILTERPIFVCKFCGKERYGNEPIYPLECPHKYKDYVVKGGETWKKIFEKVELMEIEGK